MTSLSEDSPAAVTPGGRGLNAAVEISPAAVPDAVSDSPGIRGTSSRDVTARGDAGPSPMPSGDGPALDPGGAERAVASAPPGTTPPLSGKDARDAWKAARSAQAKAKRNGRGRYPVKRAGGGYRPGTARRQPPGDGTA